MGRALGNNLINMTAYTEVKEALDEMGINLNAIEDQEPDPALGNGGLGRLAACFLDSLATLLKSVFTLSSTSFLKVFFSNLGLYISSSPFSLYLMCSYGLWLRDPLPLRYVQAED